MNQLLARQIEQAAAALRNGRSSNLAYDAQLRIAAATLSDAAPDAITATTVVGIVGQDDAAAIEALVADIAAEFRLKSELRLRRGSFSVRFSRNYDRG